MAREPFANDGATMPREALFKVTITEEYGQYERFVVAASNEQAIITLSLAGPSNIKVERVPYQVTTEDQVRGEH